MRRLIKKVMFFIVLICIIIGTYLYFTGKSLYNTKIQEISIIDKVEEIRSNENFMKLEELPINYKNAVIAVEDHRFYEHGPVDYIALTRAVFKNFKEKEIIEGGSTITQQVAKNLYFITDGDGINRKIAEIIVAQELEKMYSKDDILELYINIIYFGSGYYGVYDASKGYFGKNPSDMTLDECTLLAGIPNAPSIYSPKINPDLAKKRQKKVIKSMVEYNYLSQEQADELL